MGGTGTVVGRAPRDRRPRARGRRCANSWHAHISMAMICGSLVARIEYTICICVSPGKRLHCARTGVVLALGPACNGGGGRCGPRGGRKIMSTAHVHPRELYDRRPARMLAGSTARAPPPARLSRADPVSAYRRSTLHFLLASQFPRHKAHGQFKAHAKGLLRVCKGGSQLRGWSAGDGGS